MSKIVDKTLILRIIKLPESKVVQNPLSRLMLI